MRRLILSLVLMAGAAFGQYRPVMVNTNTHVMVYAMTNGPVVLTNQVVGGNLTVSNLTITGDMALTNTTWDDLRFPVYGLSRAGNNDPQQVFNDGPSGNMEGIYFSPTVNQELFGAGQMDHAWARGTEISPHVHFHPTTTATGAVTWGVVVSYAAIGHAWTATVTQDVTYGWTTNSQWKYFLADFEPHFPVPTNATESFGIKFRVFRNATSTNDTYPGDAALDDVDIHYQQGKVGTPDEFPAP